jgi:hypothetical protein
MIITPQQREEAARWIAVNQIVGFTEEEAFPLMVREEIWTQDQIDLVYDPFEPE